MLDPPPRGLFVPSLHHSSLSSLTPALLSGRSLRPSGSVHKAAHGSDADLLLISLSCFLLSAPTGKTPVSFVYQSLEPMLGPLITAENLSFGNDSWGLFNFRRVICHPELLSARRTKQYASTDQKSPRWPLSSSEELNLRSLLHFDRACFAMRSLLDSDYLYYPITALHSGLRPALEDTGSLLWLLYPAS